LKRLGCNSLENLLRKAGSGKVGMQALEEAVRPYAVGDEKGKAQEEESTIEQQIVPLKVAKPRKSSQSIVKIDGIDNVLVKISNCCLPMPGDAIGGFITAGRGVSVHKAECRNLVESDPNRRVSVRWTQSDKAGHKAKIQVLAQNGKGLLVSICNQVTAEDAEILDVEAHSCKTSIEATIDLVLEVADKEHLSVILQRLMQMKGVLKARRV
jgi:GTP pyrophosphokinase